MKCLTLENDSLWLALVRLLHGGKRISPAGRADFCGREIVCTPYQGNYGVAGWVMCLNGSPPRGTVLFDAPRRDPVHALIYWNGCRCRKLERQSEAALFLTSFYEKHLKNGEEAITFLPRPIAQK